MKKKRFFGAAFRAAFVPALVALLAAEASAQTGADLEPPLNEAARPKSAYVAFGGACTFTLSDDAVAAGPGVQVSWVKPRLFMDSFGLGVHAGAFVPFLISEESVKTFSGLGAALIVGPAMVVFNKGAFSIPVTVGVHADYFITRDASWVWNIGAGAVADFVWQFGKKWFAYGRAQMACNFGKFEFLITPGLGLGFSR